MRRTIALALASCALVLSIASCGSTSGTGLKFKSGEDFVARMVETADEIMAEDSLPEKGWTYSDEKESYIADPVDLEGTELNIRARVEDGDIDLVVYEFFGEAVGGYDNFILCLTEMYGDPQFSNEALCYWTQCQTSHLEALDTIMVYIFED